MPLADIVGLAAEVVFSYLLEQTNLGDKLRGYMGRDPEKLAFKTALTRTLNDLTKQYPAWVKDLFDGPFLTGGAAILLAKMLQPFAAKPTGAELADAWAEQAGLSALRKAKYSDEATTVADYFLTRLDHHLREQKPLWELLAIGDTATTRQQTEQIAVDLAALHNDLTTALSQWQATTTHSNVTLSGISNSTLTITGPIAGRDLYYTVNQLPPPVRACPVPPNMPNHFGGRNEEFNSIVDTLKSGQHVAITAVTGGGGLGKTTLARAVANEVYRQKTFRTVLWVDLTENPDPTQYLLAWAMLAEPQFEAKNRQSTALANVVRALLTDLIGMECETCDGNRVLVVLDNVWQAGRNTVTALCDAAPLGSTVLLTTRSDEVAIYHNITTRWRLDYLEGDKAIDFLLTHLPNASRESLLELAKALDGHPLAMELAAVRTKYIATARVLTIARALAQTTEEYKKGIPAGKSFADLHLEVGDTKERNLEISLSFSYHDLSEDDQRRFRQLGILPLEMVFDIRLLCYVWEEPDTRKVLAYCDALCLTALLTASQEEGWYTQHRLLRAYARALLRAETEETVAQRTIYGLLDGGFDFQQTSYITRALTYFEGALILAQQHYQKHSESTALNNIGGVWSSLGEKRKALEYYEKALLLSQAIEDRRGEAITLNNIGEVWFALGEKHKALKYLEQAFLLHRSGGDTQNEATALNNLGELWSSLGEKHKALRYFEQALPLQQSVGHKYGESTTLNNIGMVWSALGDKRKALEYYERALLLQQAVGDRRGKANTLSNTGLVWFDLGETRKALEYYEQALPLRQEVGDRGGEAKTLNNIGMVWSALGETRKALEYYEQAIPLLRTVQDRGGEATTLNNIGMAWSALGETRKALEYYEQALPLLQAIHDRRGEATTLNNIGGVWASLGKKRKALEYFEQSLPVLQAAGDKSGEAVSCFNIGMIYEGEGDIEKAIAFVARCVELEEQVEHPDLASDRQVLFRLQRKQAGVVEPSLLSRETLQTLVANTIVVCTEVPDERDDWEAQLWVIRFQVVSVGGEWVKNMALIDALLAILKGETPTLPADNPYIALVAQICATITEYNNTRSASEL